MSLFGGARVLDRAGRRRDRGRRSRRCSRRPPPKARWSRSPARCARPRACSSSPKPRRRPSPSPPIRPRAQDAERMVIDVGRRFGLKIGRRRRRAALPTPRGNDQAIVAQELQKLALYLDASPQAPKELDHDGARRGRGRRRRGRCLAAGRSGARRRHAMRWPDELARLPAAARRRSRWSASLQRRLLMLAPARARMERGETLDAVMTSLGKALFWKDKADWSSACSRSGMRSAWRRSRSAPAGSSASLMFSAGAGRRRRSARSCSRSPARRAAER